MPKRLPSSATASAPSGRAGRGRRVAELARRNQRRPARRRDAGAAHHLHGDRADDSARHRREPAGVAARRRQIDGERVFVTVPARLPAEPDGVSSATSRSASTCCRSASARRWRGRPTSRCTCAATAACSIQDLMDVFDRLKAAGVEKVGLVDEVPGRTIMDVTDVLRDRMHEPAGLQRMAAVSVAAHVIVAAWRSSCWPRPLVLAQTRRRAANGHDDHARRRRRGPRSGGLTPMGGRPVQAQTPPDEAKREAGAAAGGEDAGDDGADQDAAKPAKDDAAATVKQAPDEARGRTPTRGAETSAGQRRRRDRRARAGLRAVDAAAGRASGRRSTSPTSAVPDYLDHDDRAHSAANWNQKSERHGGCGRQVHDSAGRHALTDVALEQSSGFADARSQRAQRAVAADAATAAAAGAFPNPTLTVHLNFSISTMTNDIHSSSWPLRRPVAVVGLVASRRSRRRRRSSPPAPAPQQPSDVSTTISGEGGAPPRLAVPDFIALSSDAETAGHREDDQPGAVRRPELRARVRADSARHLRDDSRRDLVRRTCRSIAGAS